MRAFLLLLWLGVAGSGQVRLVPTSEQYASLVKRLREGDLTVDFRALRLGCAKTPGCVPRSAPADMKAFDELLEKKQFADAVKGCEQRLSVGYVNWEAHLTCHQGYTGLAQAQKAKFHMDVIQGLIRSVLTSGNGRTKETAFEVIVDREESAVLSAMGLPYFGPDVSRIIIQEDGHQWHRWDVVHPKTRQKVQVYMNTDNKVERL